MRTYEEIQVELRRATRLYIRGLTTRAAVDRLTEEARKKLIRRETGDEELYEHGRRGSYDPAH